jgi:cob(I)alamin adenosyltransferase
MSITTLRGDGGETDLLFGQRVAKTHPRIVSVGEVDELNAALGLARALAPAAARSVGVISGVQAELFSLMGELATREEDQARYEASGFSRLTAAHLAGLTTVGATLESDLQTRFTDWAVPGANTPPHGAALDLARTICRRAERAVLTVSGPGALAVAYLNRLSDVLWLLARWEARAVAEVAGDLSRSDAAQAFRPEPEACATVLMSEPSP